MEASARDLEASADLLRAQLAAAAGERAEMQAALEHAHATIRTLEAAIERLREQLAAAASEQAQTREQARAAIWTVEASAGQLRERLADAGREYGELHAALEHSRATIRDMERSRFWKARMSWVRWRARFTRGA